MLAILLLIMLEFMLLDFMGSYAVIMVEFMKLDYIRTYAIDYTTD